MNLCPTLPLVLAGALIGVLAAMTSAPRSTSSAAPPPQPPQPTGQGLVQPAVVLQPGEVATISFHSYCLDIHSAQPTAAELGPVAGLASDNIVKVLGQAIQTGVVDDPDLLTRFQPQYAIWRLDAAPESVFCVDYYTGKPIDDAEANALLDFAASGAAAPQIPPSAPDAVPLHEAVAAGSLAVDGFTFTSLDSTMDPRLPSCFTEQLRGPPPDRRFAGEGTIQVRNTGDQPLTTYLAYGTVIEPTDYDPASPVVQRLVTYYAAPGEVSPTVTPTVQPTVTLTGTPSLEPTAILTVTPTLTPTAILTPTATVEPTTVPTATPTPAPAPPWTPPVWCLPLLLLGILLLVALIFALIAVLIATARKSQQPPAPPPPPDQPAS